MVTKKYAVVKVIANEAQYNGIHLIYETYILNEPN